MKTGRDELEDRLTAMFQRQAESVPVPSPRWSELDDAQVVPVRPGRRPLFALAAAALVPVVVGVALVARTDRPQRVTTDAPAAPAADAPHPTTSTPAPAGATFHVETNQVSLSAAAVLIEADGKRFVTAAPITVHGDPGTRNEYTTLELTWQENGVEMRLNIYFTSDGHEWWSDKIWTYDGKAEGKWIMYDGDFFRRPLGTPFSGDLDISAGAGRLRISDMRLEAFRRPAVCTNPTAPYALEPDTSRVEFGGAVSAGGRGGALWLCHERHAARHCFVRSGGESGQLRVRVAGAGPDCAHGQRHRAPRRDEGDHRRHDHPPRDRQGSQLRRGRGRDDRGGRYP